MAAIRVLHVVTIMNLGGLESSLMNIYRAIDRSKIQFDFLVHREMQGVFDAEILSLGGKIFYVPPINPLQHRKYLASLKEFFSSHNEYKIVQSHINTYSMYILRAAMQAGIPIRISHAHTVNRSIELKMPFREYTKYRLKRFATDYFACGVESGKWMFGRNSKFTVIDNAVDVDRFRFDESVRDRVRQQMGIDSDTFVVGHVGSFRKVKNHSFLLDVFKAIHEKHSNSILLLIGDGALRASVEQKASKEGLADAIMFLGNRLDVDELMQAMDLFLMPSLYEGFPVVLVEAQASGLACLVSSAVSNEVQLSEAFSFLSLEETADIWANEANRLTRANDRSGAYDRFKNSKFDLATMVRDLQEFYLERLK